MYNNPYLYNQIPFNYNGTIKKGILSNLFPNSKINWSNILTNTQKTLNVINQAIPVYYQIKPIYNNAKTMFRMVSAIKNDDTISNSETKEIKDNKKNTSSHPVFFL